MPVSPTPRPCVVRCFCPPDLDEARRPPAGGPAAANDGAADGSGSAVANGDATAGNGDAAAANRDAAAANGDAATASGDAAAASGDGEAGQPSAAELAEEASFFVRREGEAPLEYALRVFERVYAADITRLLGHEVRRGGGAVVREAWRRGQCALHW